MLKKAFPLLYYKICFPQIDTCFRFLFLILVRSYVTWHDTRSWIGLEGTGL